MENPELQHLLQDLDYGHIYVIGNPKQTTNLRWFASMIEPMIRPLSLKWVETWHVDHTVIVARRFNVGNMGRYATVQLHLNRYGRSDSYSLLAAVHTFSDCLSDVMDDGQGDVIINEREYSDRNEPAHGTWGGSTSSTPLGSVLDRFGIDSAPQDHTRVEHNYYDYMESPEAMPEESPQLESEAPEPPREKMSLRKRLRKRLSRTKGAKSMGPSGKSDEDIFLSEEEQLSEAQLREEQLRAQQLREEERRLVCRVLYLLRAPVPAELGKARRTHSAQERFLALTQGIEAHKDKAAAPGKTVLHYVRYALVLKALGKVAVNHALVGETL